MNACVHNNGYCFDAYYYGAYRSFESVERSAQAVSNTMKREVLVTCYKCKEVLRVLAPETEGE